MGMFGCFAGNKSGRMARFHCIAKILSSPMWRKQPCQSSRLILLYRVVVSFSRKPSRETPQAHQVIFNYPGVLKTVSLQVVRREDLERKRKRKKVEWMKKM